MRSATLILWLLLTAPARADSEKYVAWPGDCPGAKARVPRGCYVRQFKDRVEIHCKSGVQVLRPCVRKMDTLAGGRA